MHVKTGDQVIVISGNDRGATGEVLSVDRSRNRVVVAGVNIRTKHVKPTQQSPKGDRVQRESAIHASNVQHVDPVTGRGTRKRPASPSSN